MTTVKIYTKPNCIWCREAKKILDLKGLTYEELDITVPENRAALLNDVPNATTVPQIFIDNSHIGSYTQLREHYGLPKPMIRKGDL